MRLLGALALGALAALALATAFYSLVSVLEEPAAPATDRQGPREEIATLHSEDPQERRAVPSVDPVPDPEAPAPAWSPEPGTPAALFGPEIALTYQPTVANLRTWASAIPELAGVQVEWTDDVQRAWTVCVEHLAFRRFVLRYRDRDHSVPLEFELAPVAAWEAKNIGFLDGAVAAYSSDVEGSRDVLLYAMMSAGEPAFQYLADLLRQGN